MPQAVVVENIILDDTLETTQIERDQEEVQMQEQEPAFEQAPACN